MKPRKRCEAVQHRRQRHSNAPQPRLRYPRRFLAGEAFAVPWSTCRSKTRLEGDLTGGHSCWNLGCRWWWGGRGRVPVRRPVRELF